MRRLGSIIVLCSLFSATPAQAEDLAVADALFQKGLADMEAGRLETACPAIGESMRLDPRPGTLFTLAECEAKAGKVATAVARYEDYLQLFARMTPQQQKKQLNREKIAAAQKAALSGEVPSLTIVPPENMPKGTRVLRDGVELTTPALNLPLPVDPGEHSIVLEIPGSAPSEQKLTIAKREQRTVQLEIKTSKIDPPLKKPEPPKPLVKDPLPAPVTTGSSGRRKAAYLLGGVGASGIVIGAVAGGLVFAKKSTIAGNCKGLDCNQTGFDAVSEANTLGLVSTVAFIGGGASLLTGALLFFTEPKLRPKTGAGGRWASASVAPHTQGVIAHVQGVW